MTSQLTVYNGALRNLGQRRLASLTENVPARHELDAVWADDFIESVLEQGLWNFATRTTRRDYAAEIEPDFGFRRAFLKPDDFVRTAMVAGDEYFASPLSAYADEQGYWFCDLDELYVSYVSSDDSYGADLSLWPPSFTRFAEVYLAYRIAPAIAPKMYDTVFKLQRRHLVEARSRDAMNQPTQMLPAGDWVQARRRGRSDRGSRHQLTE